VEYRSVEEARNLPGLRIVLTPGLPAPWSEACKNLFQVKRLDYVPAQQEPAQSDGPLREWTAQTSAPVVAWEGERPRSTWIEQLYLAERLQPEPALIPADRDDRIAMIGFAHELLGENGFIWNRRHMLVDYLRAHSERLPPNLAHLPDYLAETYLYTEADAKAAPERCAAVLTALDQQLAEQQERGSRFLVGDSLSALDLYWAAVAVLVEPLPADVNPMPELFRALYSECGDMIRRAATERLLEHRERIYREFLTLPLDF